MRVMMSPIVKWGIEAYFSRRFGKDFRHQFKRAPPPRKPGIEEGHHDNIQFESDQTETNEGQICCCQDAG